VVVTEYHKDQILPVTALTLKKQSPSWHLWITN